MVDIQHSKTENGNTSSVYTQMKTALSTAVHHFQPFDRKKIPSSDDPKSLAKKQLYSALTLHYTLNPTNDERNVSAQYLAYESIFRMYKPSSPPQKDDPATALPLVQCERDGWALGYEISFPPSANIEQVNYGGVDSYWITYPHMKSWKQTQFILYYHGGGFMVGDIYTQAGVCADISKNFDVPLLYVNYKCAPEYSFPAQLEDALSVHKALLEEDSTCANRMITYGESAGGTLSLLHVQWCDLTCTLPSYTDNQAVDFTMTTPELVWNVNVCFGGTERMAEKRLDAKTTEMSPLNHTFVGFPPTYITAGGSELLTSDSEEAYKRLKEANADVTLYIAPHMSHNYMNMGQLFPEAAIAMVSELPRSGCNLPA